MISTLRRAICTSILLTLFLFACTAWMMGYNAIGKVDGTSTLTTLSASDYPRAHPLPHRKCAQEDSTYCVWDARHMGNGAGKSFWVGTQGRVHYITHRFAHRLIWG